MPMSGVPDVIVAEMEQTEEQLPPREFDEAGGKSGLITGFEILNKALYTMDVIKKLPLGAMTINAAA